MTNTYVPLANITLTSTDSEIVFSSIPATYRDLVLVWNGSTTGNTDLRLRYNLDANNNYFYVAVDNTFNQASTSSSAHHFMFSTTAQWSHISHIMDYSATDKQKTTLSRRNSAGHGTVAMEANRWANTAAIHTVSVTAPSNPMQVGTTISLYGVAA